MRPQRNKTAKKIVFLPRFRKSSSERKGVSLLLWVHSGNGHHAVSRRPFRDPEQDPEDRPAWSQIVTAFTLFFEKLYLSQFLELQLPREIDGCGSHYFIHAKKGRIVHANLWRENPRMKQRYYTPFPNQQCFLLKYFSSKQTRSFWQHPVWF